MRIILDAMGGDLGCEPVVLGAAEARRTSDHSYILVGDETQLRAVFARTGLSEDGFTIMHAPEVVTMEDDPTRVVREKRQSSMAVGLTALKRGDGDVFISSCNTGALLTGATLLVGRVRGVRRATLGVQLPTKKNHGVVIIDTGANAECTPEYLEQFALMGSAYAETFGGIESPRVGLLSNGTEAHKGNTLVKQAHALLDVLGQKGLIHFIGNVEARELMSGDIDVVVCDGFTGNVLLKSIEGTASFMMSLIKKAFLANTMTKLGALLVKSQIGSLKKMMDYREIGATPILGISRPVFKAHGASDAVAWAGAIRSAAGYAGCGADLRIAEKLEARKGLDTDGTADSQTVD